MPEHTSGTNTEGAAGRYEELASRRNPYLRRARELAKLTIPSLFPPQGHGGSDELYQPFQSVGARGVDNLASKLLIALLPPNTPFFKLTVDPFVMDELREQTGDEGAETEVKKSLSKVERAVMADIETKADRSPAFEAFKNLIVGGNVMLHDDDEEGIRVFHLEQYVVKRDPRGRPIEMIVKETVAPVVLPAEVREVVQEKNEQANQSTHENVDLYTWIKREGDKWKIHQEVSGAVVPSSEGEYPVGALPWFPLRMVHISGEDYGRAYAEEFMGDLKSLEGLMKSIVEGTAAAARVLILVNPNGTTRQSTIAQAPNGAIREGDINEVGVLQLDKFNDFRVALETINRLEHRLEQAFLLNSSVQRDAERVTAEEIRLMAQELEEILGGIYSILSQEFQLPYVEVKLRRLSKKPSWPRLPKDIVRPTIVTGLEALGRSHDRQKLVQYIRTLSEVFGPEAAAKAVNLSNFADRLAAADGIDTEGLIRSEGEMAQGDMRQLMAQMAQKLGPDFMKLVQQQAEQQQEQGDT